MYIIASFYCCNNSHKFNVFCIFTLLPASFPVNYPISSLPTLPPFAPLLHSYSCFLATLWNPLFIITPQCLVTRISGFFPTL